MGQPRTLPLPPEAHLRLTEAELRRTAERLHLALDAAEMGIWDWDLSSGALNWNENLQRMWGYAPGEFSGSIEDFWKRLHPADVDRVRGALEACRLGDAEYLIEYRVQNPALGERWVLARGVTYFDEAGQPVRMMGVGLDVTERHRQEQALREGAHRLEVALSAADLGLWELELATGRGSCDELTAELSGLPPGQAIACDALRQTVHPEDWPRCEEALRRVRGSAGVVQIECRVARPDGSLRWLAIAGRTERGADGEPVRVIGVVRDCTAEREARGSLLRAIELREQFLSVAAHELKTPLMGLRLQADLARRQLEAGVPPLQVLQKLLDGNERHRAHVERFADDLLDATRLATGHLSFQQQHLDLGALVVEMAGRFTEALERARSPLTLRNEPGVFVLGDRVRIDQVLSNLLSNAIRHAPGARIEIRTSRVGERARLEVSDEGPGIPLADQHRIFERFERGGVHRGPGLGLGLFIVREIVEGHGGTVQVDSAPGRGARFVIELPAA